MNNNNQNTKKIFSSTRINEAITSGPFIRENGQVDGNPRALGAVAENWDEPPFEATTASAVTEGAVACTSHRGAATKLASSASSRRGAVTATKSASSATSHRGCVYSTKDSRTNHTVKRRFLDRKTRSECSNRPHQSCSHKNP